MLVRRALTEKLLDILGADTELFIMILAQFYLIVVVKISVGLAVLIEPDERSGDLEVHFHRLVAFVSNERMAFARRFVDEVAGRCDPVML